jgi:hypothetical protein
VALGNEAPRGIGCEKIKKNLIRIQLKLKLGRDIEEILKR